MLAAIIPKWRRQWLSLVHCFAGAGPARSGTGWDWRGQIVVPTNNSSPLGLWGSKARMHGSRAESRPVTAWCASAWYLRPDVVGFVEKALARMTNLISHLFRANGERWLDWYIRYAGGSWQSPGATTLPLSLLCVCC